MNLFELQSVLGSGSRYQGNILYGSDTESRKDVMIGNVIYLFGKYLTLFFFPEISFLDAWSLLELPTSYDEYALL